MNTTTVFDLIRAPKTEIKIGDWKQGKIVGFQLKNNGSIPVGPSWHHRICEFNALGLQCKVLIRLNPEISRYQAVLAVQSAGALRVVCHHELHIGDKGWHCHFCTGSVLDVFPGVMRDRDRMVARELQPSLAENTDFTVTKANALTKAADRYRFRAQGELM